MRPEARGLARLEVTAGLRSAWTPRTKSTLLVPWYLRRLERRRNWLARLGLQPEPFLRILELKLENDTRGANGQPGRTLTIGIAILFTLSWLAGLLPAIVGLAAHPPALWWMALVSAMQSFLLLFFLLSMYDTILVEATDVALIAPLPVSDRTLFATRIAHVLFYVGLMTLCASFWPLVLGPLCYTWWAVLLGVPLVSALTCMLCVGGIALVYALLLRVLGPGRFQRASLYMQVLALVGIMAGPQLLPRLVNVRPLVAALGEDARWQLLLPPAWFGGLFEAIEGQHDALTLGLAALALGVPLVLLLLALRLASRHFVSALASGPGVERATDARWKRGATNWLAQRLTKSRVERAGWDLTLALVRRDRLFLRGAWPGFLGSSVMGLVVTLPMRSGRHMLPPQASGFGLYMCALAFASMFMLVRYSENAKARWIYAARPIAAAEDLVRGAAKALCFGVFLPVQMLASLVPLALAGPVVLPSLVLMWMTSAMVVLGAIPWVMRDLPFCYEQNPSRMHDKGLLPLLAYTFILMLAAGVHGAASLHWASQLALGLLLAGLIRVVWKRLDKIRVEPMPAP